MALSEETGTFRREVRFEPGYNYLHEKGPSARGQYGMQIRFILIGDQGAAQFLMGTGWTPLGEVDPTDSREPCHIDYWQESTASGFRHKFGLVNPPSGYDLGYHWASPLYDGQTANDCEYTLSGECYYDGSGTRADDVLKDFIAKGETGVWEWLEKRYQWCLELEEGLRVGGS